MGRSVSRRTSLNGRHRLPQQAEMWRRPRPNRGFSISFTATQIVHPGLKRMLRKLLLVISLFSAQHFQAEPIRLVCHLQLTRELDRQHQEAPKHECVKGKTYWTAEYLLDTNDYSDPYPRLEMMVLHHCEAPDEILYQPDRPYKVLPGTLVLPAPMFGNVYVNRESLEVYGDGQDRGQCRTVPF